MLNKNDRSILGNYYFFGPDRELLAVLRGVRCQAVQVRRDNALDANAFVELPEPIVGAILGVSGLAAPAAVIMRRARRHGLLSDRTAAVDEAELLIEGAATAAAYGIAAGLADRDWIDIDALIGGGRLPAELGPWLERLLASLTAAGLAKQQNGRWQVIDDAQMPGVAPVIQELSAKHPDRAAEIFILGAIAGIAEQIAASGAISGSPDLALSASVLDFYDAASVSARQATTVLECLLDDDALWPKDRTLRVLQVGFGPPTQSLLALHRKRDIALTIIEPDRRRFDSAQGFLAKHGNVTLVDADQAAELGKFDLVVAVENLHRLPSSIGLGGVRQWLSPRAVLLALEPAPSLFRHILSGLARGDATTANLDSIFDEFSRPDEWSRALERAGFINAQAGLVTRSQGQFSLIVAEADSSAMPEAASIMPTTALQLEPQTTLIFDSTLHSASELGVTIDRLLRKQGASVALTHTLDFSDPAPATLVHVLTMDQVPSEAVSSLTTCCMEMKACAQRFGSAPATLWFVFNGALTNNAGTINPIATGAWAFARTLANEFQHLDVRRIDIAPTFQPVSPLHDCVTSSSPAPLKPNCRSTIRWSARCEPIRSNAFWIAPPCRPSALCVCSGTSAAANDFVGMRSSAPYPGPRRLKSPLEPPDLIFAI